MSAPETFVSMSAFNGLLSCAAKMEGLRLAGFDCGVPTLYPGSDLAHPILGREFNRVRKQDMLRYPIALEAGDEGATITLVSPMRRDISTPFTVGHNGGVEDIPGNQETHRILQIQRFSALIGKVGVEYGDNGFPFALFGRDAATSKLVPVYLPQEGVDNLVSVTVRAMNDKMDGLKAGKDVVALHRRRGSYIAVA